MLKSGQTGDNMYSTLYKLLLIVIIVLNSSINAQQKNIEQNYLNEVPPGLTPKLFAKGIISTQHYEHGNPSFSPFFNEIYWSIRINGEYGKEIINYVKKVNGKWGEVQTASFSKSDKGDLYPTFSYDGNSIYFTSDRETGGQIKSATRGIWKTDRENNNWGEVKIVGFDSLDIFGLSIAENGNLYFMAQKSNVPNAYDLYYSKFINGVYQKPEKLAEPLSTEYYEDCPFISRDEKFLIFESNRPGGAGNLDFYISYKLENGSWGEPINLGTKINSKFAERFPYISPDGKYFFFANDSTGNFDIYWVSASVLSNINNE